MLHTPFQLLIRGKVSVVLQLLQCQLGRHKVNKHGLVRVIVRIIVSLSVRLVLGFGLILGLGLGL